MGKDIINEILQFVKECDNDFFYDAFEIEKASKATEYMNLLEKNKIKSNLVLALIEKLEFIKNQIYARNYHSYQKDAILNLVSLSVTDYVIALTKEKRILDPLLIARYVYIELSKVLYYDISYVKQTDEACKKALCEAAFDFKKEKIFSYILCTQWIQLYSYILSQFGINVDTKKIPGQDHVWGEIKLNDEYIIVADATDYIGSSIDLSNAKSVSPTVGFAVLPKEYSGIRLYDVFNNRTNIEIAKKIMDCYKLNRDLDMSLGYIDKKGYKVESIVREHELFNYPERIISDESDLKKYIDMSFEFFKKLKIPNNMDGYEVFAYYNKFINKLPMNVAANISQKTMYVDSFEYKQDNIRKKFLQAPHEYLGYLDRLIYDRYYKYLSEEENNSVLEKIKNRDLNEEQVRNLIVEYEMKIAQINKRLNLYYAINKMQFFDPTTADTLGIKLFEPMMGSKVFNNIDEYNEFKKKKLIY